MSARARYQPWFRSPTPVEDVTEYREPVLPRPADAMQRGERVAITIDLRPRCRNCQRPQDEHVAGAICPIGLFCTECEPEPCTCGRGGP